jgi:hypothetical protein
MITKTTHGTTEHNQQIFLDDLALTQEWFDAKGIDYRVVGSVAASAYLDPPGHTSLDFDRQGASTASQRVPDIDLIVSRKDLPEVREYRDRLKGVKLGLALPTRFIDFRPQREISYLTHNRKKFPIKSNVFNATHEEFLGVPITTLSPASLVHTYFSIRERDRAKVSGLKRLAGERQDDNADSADYVPFKEFSTELAKHKSLLDSSVETTVKMLEALPPPVRMRAFRCALVFADIAHLR